MPHYPSIGPDAVTQALAGSETIPADSAWHTLATINITLDGARSLLMLSYLSFPTWYDFDANNPQTRIVLDGTPLTLTQGLTIQENPTQSAHALAAVASGARTILLQAFMTLGNAQIYTVSAGALTVVVVN